MSGLFTEAQLIVLTKAHVCAKTAAVSKKELYLPGDYTDEWLDIYWRLNVVNAVEKDVNNNLTADQRQCMLDYARTTY